MVKIQVYKYQIKQVTLSEFLWMQMHEIKKGKTSCLVPAFNFPCTYTTDQVDYYVLHSSATAASFDKIEK